MGGTGGVVDQTYQVQDTAGAMALFAGVFLMAFVIFIVFYIVGCLGLMRMFQKAGKPGWAAFVPFYNIYIIVRMIHRPMWWFYIYVGYTAISFLSSWATSQQLGGSTVLSFVMFGLGLAVLVLTAIACYDLAKAFGRGIGTAIGLFFLSWIFSLILGFGSAEYEGGKRGTSAGSFGAGIGTPGPAFAGAAGAGSFGAPTPTAPSPYAAAGYTADLSPASPTPGGDWTRPNAATSPSRDSAGRSASGISSSAFAEAAPAGASPASKREQMPPMAAATPSWPPLDDASRPAFTMAPPAAPVPPLGSRMPEQGATA